MAIVVKEVNKVVENKPTEKTDYARKPITAKLEWFEVSTALHIAGLRSTESLRMGLKDHPTYRGRDQHDNLYGVLGEIAFAKATDSYFPMSVNTFKGADIGSNWQVRTVGSNKNRDLIIRPKDSGEHYYVLVEIERSNVTSAYTYTIHGWIHGSDGKNDKYLSDFGYADRAKAFRIPQNRLNPPHQMPI
mgnify:FL=1